MAENGSEKKTDILLKKLIKKGFCLLVCLSAIIAISYAWFHYAGDVRSDGIEIVSIEAVGFEASLDGNTYFDSVSLTFPDNLRLSPVSGDGMTDGMFCPVLPTGSDNADEAIMWTPVYYDEEAENNSFYRLHVFFRADVPGYVALSGVSVDPLAAPGNRQSEDYNVYLGGDIKESVPASGTVDRPFEGSLTTKLIENANLLTRDYMAAATRVSITNTGEVAPGISKHFIIVPNAGFRLNTEEFTDVTTGETRYRFTMTESLTDDNPRRMYHYYNGRKALYGERDFNVFDAYSISDGEMQYVLRLWEDSSDGFFKGEIDICLWVEGYDEEATDIFSDGKITMNLTFRYVESAPEI